MFQDSIMKSVFDSYPEVILVDATYKLNNLRMPLYLMMCIGQGEIVLMFFTTMETEEAITKMVKHLIAQIPNGNVLKLWWVIKTSMKGQYSRKSFLMLHYTFACSCPENVQKRNNNRQTECSSRWKISCLRNYF